LKRYSEAVPMFEQSVRLDSESEPNLGNLADAYRWAGRINEANKTYGDAIQAGLKALVVNSRDAARMGRMSQYYAKKGDIKHAFDFVHRARAIDAKDSSLVYAEAVVDWLAGREQDAAQNLEQALKAGYPLQAAQNDPELSKLQTLPQFTSLIKQSAAQSK
jgi:tetratricopeptide (TPR) repeat protein